MDKSKGIYLPSDGQQTRSNQRPHPSRPATFQTPQRWINASFWLPSLCCHCTSLALEGDPNVPAASPFHLMVFARKHESIAFEKQRHEWHLERLRDEENETKEFLKLCSTVKGD